MTLTQSELLAGARHVATEALDHIDEYFVHEMLERRYGALTDEQAREILSLASNAQITI